MQLKAVAAGCPNPLYEFWVLAPGATRYALAQAYGASDTLNWDTAGRAAGTYRITVWTRDKSSAGLSGNSFGRWDAYNAGRLYTLTRGCASVTDAVSPAGGAMRGMTATVTATASGCPNPVYEFWVRAPGASLYTLSRAYGPSNTFSLDTTGKAFGTYNITVWVRDAGSVGTSGNAWGRWDTYNASVSYVVSAGCPSVTTSSAVSGTDVVVSAAAPGCPKPLYEFWVLAPGTSVYTLGRAYASSSTFTWSTAGRAPGTYRFNVWVRDASSTGTSGNSSGRWDAFNASLLFTK